jgi:hypothetical protein
MLSAHDSLARLQHSTDTLLADARTWPPESLRHHPAPDAWSALDVLDHLRRSEAGIAKAMRSRLHSPHPVSMLDRARSLQVFAILRAPIRMKVPKAVRAFVLPDPPPDLETLAAEWQRSRDIINTVIAELPPANERLGIFLHPLGGWMTPSTTLRFLAAHMQHHEPQWQRIRRSASAP